MAKVRMDSKASEADDGNSSLTERSGRIWAFAGWSFALGLVLVAGLRFACHDAINLLVWLNAFTVYLYLPAYLILVFACWQRRLWLAAVSGFVVACHLFWVAPDFQPATPLESLVEAKDRSTLRIMFFNASLFNEKRDEVVDEIAGVDPDIIVLAEFNPQWQATLRSAHLMKNYAYGTDLAAPFPGEVVVFSRIPVARPMAVWVVARPFIAIEVPLDNRQLRLFCLHSPRPMKWPAHDYWGYWKVVLPAIAEQPRPLVVVGDFNTTQHNLIYQQLTATGLRSAHVDRGRGYAATWPNSWHFIPPIRIDQAFLSPEVECLRIEEGVGVGSDHEPLILDVRLRLAM